MQKEHNLKNKILLKSSFLFLKNWGIWERYFISNACSPLNFFFLKLFGIKIKTEMVQVKLGLFFFFSPFFEVFKQRSWSLNQLQIAQSVLTFPHMEYFQGANR